MPRQKPSSSDTYDREKGYNTISSDSKSPTIFCVHGNKYGVVNCCEEMPQMFFPQDDPHCHTERENKIDQKARKKLITASILCVVFMIVEITGGILANSLAIATDAAHLLTDFASFMISLFSLWVASRPATRQMSFGWHRAEVIGATVSVLMIWVVTGILVYMAAQRIITQDFEIDAQVMLITSGIGVLFNLIMGCSLHQHGHGHGHSHGGDDEEDHLLDHHDTSQVNINVKAAYIHVIGDFIQSLGVFIAALVLYFNPTWVLVDPICTFVFSILVLFTTIKILKDTVNVLMEGTPKSINYDRVKQVLLSVDGIQTVHNLRIWGITTDKSALSAHLAIRPGTKTQEVLKEASGKIRQIYNFYEMTLQIEEFSAGMRDCTQCQNPED